MTDVPQTGRTQQAIRDDIYEHVGRDEPLLGLMVELESAVARDERERIAPLVDAVGRYIVAMSRRAAGTASEDELQAAFEVMLAAVQPVHGDHPRDSYRYDGCPGCEALGGPR